MAVCRGAVWVSCVRGRTAGLRILTESPRSLSLCHHHHHHHSGTTEPNLLHPPTPAFPCPQHRARCLELVPKVLNPALSKSLQWIPPTKHRKFCSCSSRILPLSHFLSSWINAGVRPSLKGYSTTPGKAGFKDDPNASNPETNSSASSTSLSNQRQFKELYENPWTIPNFLCMSRIVLSPVLGYLIMEQYFQLSLGLFVLAGATDMLDGFIARKWPNQKSALGSALDPLADKILISVLYISLTYSQLIPVPLTALVISRDIVLIAAVFYVRYKTVPPPVTLSKFFNPCYTTAQLKPTLISKFNTAIQLILVAVSLASPIFHYTDSVLLQSLWYVTALTTAASGYSYYHYGRKTVEVLNNRK